MRCDLKDGPVNGLFAGSQLERDLLNIFIVIIFYALANPALLTIDAGDAVVVVTVSVGNAHL